MKHAVLPVATLLALLAAATACKNTREGVAKDAEIAAERADIEAERLEAKAKEGAEKVKEVGGEVAAEVKEGATHVAGEVKEGADVAAQAGSELLDAAALRAAAAKRTLDVKTALLADKRVDASRIDVDSDPALEIVHLRGAVSTQAEKEIGEAIAREHASGWTVSNALAVRAK